MIDYDKLRKAHKLILKTPYWFTIEIGRNVQDADDPWINYYILQDGGAVIYEDSDIDFIIDRIKELAQPDPKYKVGGTVYFMNTSTGVMEGEVTHINKHNEYKINGIHIQTENSLYSSLEDLIDAQIEHWQQMKDSLVPSMEQVREYADSAYNEKCEHDEKQCIHEPYVKMPTLNDGGIVQKCKKCGEFYSELF